MSHATNRSGFGHPHTDTDINLTDQSYARPHTDTPGTSPAEIYAQERRQRTAFHYGLMPRLPNHHGPPVSFLRYHALGPEASGQVPDVFAADEEGVDAEIDGWRVHRVSFTPHVPPPPSPPPPTPAREGTSRVSSPPAGNEQGRGTEGFDQPTEAQLSAAEARFAQIREAHARARARFIVPSTQTDSMASSDSLGLHQAAHPDPADGSTSPPPQPVRSRRTTRPTPAPGPHPAIPTPFEAAEAAARATRAVFQPQLPHSAVQGEIELTEADLLHIIGPLQWEDELFFFDSTGNMHIRAQQPVPRSVPRSARRGAIVPPPAARPWYLGEEEATQRTRRSLAVADLPPPGPQRHHRRGGWAVNPDGPRQGPMHHPAYFEAQNRHLPTDIYHGVPLAWRAAPKSALESLTTRLLTEVDMGEDGKTNCAICTFDAKVGEVVTVLPMCKHFFHGDCIKEWLEEYNANCPLCRAAVTDGSVPTTTAAGSSDTVVANERRVQSREELEAAYLERRRRRNEARAATGARITGGFFEDDLLDLLAELVQDETVKGRHALAWQDSVLQHDTKVVVKLSDLCL